MAGLDDFSLDGLVALVPGGGGGIGSALAVALAGAGANVVVGGRTQESLDATVAQVEAAGGEGLAVVADATDEADAERLVQRGGRALRPPRHPDQRGRRRRRQGPAQRRDLSPL